MSCIDSSLWVKICGLTIPEQAVAIAAQGASAIGFIGVPASPRYVTPLQMRAMSGTLIAAHQTSVERVGVFVDASMDTLSTAVETGQLTTLQLHGHEAPSFCRDIRHRHPHLKLIKAFRIRHDQDLQAVLTYEDSVDAILLDAYHPQMMGGTGETLNWQLLRSFVSQKPWILAGGLTPNNIEAALESVTPQGIDLSSGVELSPGNKCLTQTQQLFERLAQWQRGSVSP
jgi:phosphoribosylanthranilate isomerase